MSKYCIVAPVHICQALRDRGDLGYNHLLLAHDVVKHPNEYRDLFACNGGYTILDNSVAELGTAVDLDMVVKAASICRPTVTVLPDVYLDATATLRNCHAALDVWSRRFVSKRLPAQFLFIPQGKSFDEFAWCAEGMAKQDPRITWWGVPRNIVQYVGSRERCIKLVKMLNPIRQIHMMGFSDDLRDDLLCARMPEVTTIDSAVPVRVQEPLRFSTIPGKRGTWWEDGKLSDLNVDNILHIRRLVDGYGF